MRILWISTALVFLVLGALTASLSLAAFSSNRIESRLAHWSSLGYLEDEREWQSLYEENQSWYRLFPYNPRHLRNRIQLIEWRAHLQRLYPDYAKKSVISALEGHRELIRQIPSQGYGWASIAALRADQLLFTDESVEALENAVALNPVEDLAQRRIIRSGIEHWNKWPEESKNLIRQTIENALQTDTTLQSYPITSFVYDVALSNEWEDELQPFLISNWLRSSFEQRKRHREIRSRIN